MNIDLTCANSIVLHLEQVHRWDVYHRLRELSIPCWCATGQPLRVAVDDAATLIQVWAVLKSCTTSCAARRIWLERCWQV
jgi:hypothetical protein